MIANRNVALSHGKNKKTTKRTVAAMETTPIGRQPGLRRTAAAIVSGASAPVVMISRNAIACIQPCQVAGLPPLSIGVSTLNAAKISATPNRVTSATAKPLARRCGS